MAYCSEDIRGHMNEVRKMLETEIQELKTKLARLPGQVKINTDEVCKNRLSRKKEFKEFLDRESNSISEMRLRIQDLNWDIEDRKEPDQEDEMFL